MGLTLPSIQVNRHQEAQRNHILRSAGYLSRPAALSTLKEGMLPYCVVV